MGVSHVLGGDGAGAHRLISAPAPVIPSRREFIPVTHPTAPHAMYSLTTTTARIDACNPCYLRWQRAAKLLNITEPSDEPITYAQLLNVLGLDDALWCCRAEPDLAPIWRRYAVWCARQVQHLMTDQRSLDTLDVAERHARGAATDEELAAAWDAADAAWAAAARDAADAAMAAARAAVAPAAARDAARAAARDAQVAAFRRLVTTGALD